ncbi:NAD-dependent epimerase/dehydratase family protein [Brucepastera parasyntrophica]|uniref:NAD-dependent epimerase/dehydratase family protein n=1 Tax=Brucepastera parasyntrophica TaxID=2880008 RepID=UPI00210D7974|nr:NAD-dependent epimerase/dehydratase family protein [Brucepastera parasyntrophica]ULQ59886.1 NAD-dependent epimerase/dehydratase family protein [Brucepastera parasyntrophica]
MNIAVIGGSGFVGTRLVSRLLAAGYTVKILDKNISNFFPEIHVFADVREQSALERELTGTDIVINLAAEHRDDVSPISLYDDVNVKGAENVCLACNKLGIRKIIFTSSVAVYGFAPVGTDETGEINYFNAYGRTKWEAEGKYRHWLSEDEKNSLTIIRPTVIFGERNRGNVYNLLRQITNGVFPMVGKGTNLKSMAYVENVAAFIEYNLHNNPGEYLYNYIDKPDFDMNTLVSEVYTMMGKPNHKIFHWPYWLGYFGGLCFDFLGKVLHKKLPISSIRVKKFCANTMFEANNIKATQFIPPVSLIDGLKNTIKYEFIDKTEGTVFYTE